MVLIKDFMWEVAQNSGDDNSSIPSWSGFNALVTTNTVPVTKIRYLPFINASPCDFSTIFTTLLRLVHISEELGQHHIAHNCYGRPRNLQQGTTYSMEQAGTSVWENNNEAGRNASDNGFPGKHLFS